MKTDSIIDKKGEGKKVNECSSQPKEICDGKEIFWKTSQTKFSQQMRSGDLFASFKWHTVKPRYCVNQGTR